MPLRTGLLALLFMAICYNGKAFTIEKGVLQKYYIQKANFDVNDDPSFKSKEEAQAYKRKHNIKGRIKRQSDGTYAIENKREHSSIAKNAQSGKVEKAALAAAPKDGMTNVLLSPERRAPYTGLSGKLTYIWTGGNENGIKYNVDGYPLGPSPTMDTAPTPGPGKGIKLLRFRGLIQNRALRSLTHQQLVKAFENTGFLLSGHAIKRLKDVRTLNIGFKTLNDIKQIFNKGAKFTARDGLIGRSYKGMEVIYNPNTKVIVTFRPAKVR